jgi:Flp pilus assembly protein TadD
MSQIPISSERSANIFINYRREDSAGHTGRLFDRLSARLPGRVFMDIDTLEPGVDFAEVIENAVGSCQVLIVVIGNEWLRVEDAAGHRRLDDEADYVRLELATALQRSIRVIPVLVQGAPMPRAEELPADIARLARRNAIELSDARWAYDVDRLIRTIEEVLRGLDLRASEAAAAAAQSHEVAPAATSAPATTSATAAIAARPRAWMAVLAAVVVCGLVSAGWVVKQQGAHGVVVPASTAPTAPHRAPATVAPAGSAPAAPTVAAAAPAARAAAAPAATARARISSASASAPPAPAPAAPAPAAPAAAVPAAAARAAAAQASVAQAPTARSTAPVRAAPAPAAPVPAAPAPAAPVPAAPAAAVPAPALPLTTGPGDRARPGAGAAAAVPDAAMAAPGSQAKSAKTYETLGMKCLQEGRYNEAVTALTSAIDLRRNAPGGDPLDALYARSIAYNRSGRAADAISDLESLVKARDDLRYREELAIAYAQVGKREAAIGQYRSLLQSQPDNAWFNFKIGLLYIKERDYRKAAQAFEKALANRKQLTGTTLADTYDSLGIAYFYLCWREEAVAAFKKAAELNPEYAPYIANAERLTCQRQ